MIDMAAQIVLLPEFMVQNKKQFWAQPVNQWFPSLTGYNIHFKFENRTLIIQSI